MNCPLCNVTNDADAEFCTGCGQSILLAPSPTVGLPPNTGAPPSAQSAAPMHGTLIGQKTAGLVVAADGQALTPAVRGFAPGEVLALRGIDEEEGKIEPHQRRPLEVWDEQMFHLANTSRRLELPELLARVKTIIEFQEVPVDVQAVNACWLKDRREVRPRLVACLRNHSFSDIKMVMGVDYMGRWASIKLYVGTEPEPIEPAAAPPSWSPPLDAIIALIGGVMLLLIVGGIMGIFLGVLGIGYGLVRLQASYKAHLARLALEEGKKLAQLVSEKLKREERRARTFKKDDLLLFSTAMRRVFQVVVDDIVAQGAEVVRVEGGRGGYFQPEGDVQPARQSDAAEAEI